ncbi:hypothetical protein EV714DRAFT_278190 [Schizophyllum commune]
MRRGISSSYSSIICRALWLEKDARSLGELVAMASSCRFSTVSGERRRPSSSSSGFPYALHSRRAPHWALSKLHSSTLLPCLFFPSAASKFLEQLISRVEHDFFPYALHSRSTRFSAILKLQRSHLDARRSPSCIARSASPRTSSLCLVRVRVPKALEPLVDHVQHRMSKVLEQLTGCIEHLLMESIASFLALCTPLYVAIGHIFMMRPCPAPVKILVNK